MTWVNLIEVKFRSVFSQETAIELFETLTYQRRYWPQAHVVIVLGEPFQPEAKFHQDYIRVIIPGRCGDPAWSARN